MFGLLRRKEQFLASVFFRGTLPPRAAEFDALARQGVKLTSQAGNDRMHWSMKMEHPSWGSATAYAVRNMLMPPRELIEFDPWLSPHERDELAGAGNCVTIESDTGEDDVLRRRKKLMRFVAAIMGDDGLGALDHLSQRFWSPAQLSEELSHDADLDIQSLYTVHAVTDEGRLDAEGHAKVIWAHTHGIAELGGFDFDIIEPAGHVAFELSEVIRALAFLIVEGQVKKEQGEVWVVSPGGAVALVDAATFQRKAPRHEASLRDDPSGEHIKNRVVLCEPRTGLWGRLFGKVRAARWLKQPYPEHGLVQYSDMASQLMASRANSTYSMFAGLVEELKEFKLPMLVKLGYETDAGNGSREHLWFEVNQCHDDSIDATCKSQPYDIARIKAEDRAVHPISRLSDWCILTPAGMINPRQTAALRILRDNREEILQAMQESEAAEQEA